MATLLCQAALLCNLLRLRWANVQRGQLGHGDQTQRNVPTVVEALAGKSMVSGALP